MSLLKKLVSPDSKMLMLITYIKHNTVDYFMRPMVLHDCNTENEHKEKPLVHRAETHKLVYIDCRE